MNNQVEVEVVQILERGVCPVGHKVGDKWVFNRIAPAGLCANAISAMFPIVQTLRFGGCPHWGKDGKARVCCPDFANPVVFELRRLDDAVG